MTGGPGASEPVPPGGDGLLNKLAEGVGVAESADGGGSIRVMVEAGYPAIRAGFRSLLFSQPDMRPVTDSADSSPGSIPDVIVADAGSVGASRLDALAEQYPQAGFVHVGGDPSVDGAGLEGGPVAYLGPDADGERLALAVRAVAQGLTVIDPAVIAAAGIHVHPRIDAGSTGQGETLTAREREVLALVATGLPNKGIARELGISEHTAKFHVGSLLAKLGAGSRTEAVTLATRRGLLAV